MILGQLSFVYEKKVSQNISLVIIGVRAGVARGAAAPPASEITGFFGKNAHDSGNDT